LQDSRTEGIAASKPAISKLLVIKAAIQALKSFIKYLSAHTLWKVEISGILVREELRFRELRLGIGDSRGDSRGYEITSVLDINAQGISH